MLESCRSQKPNLRPQLSDHRVLPHAPQGQRCDHTLGRRTWGFLLMASRNARKSSGTGFLFTPIYYKWSYDPSYNRYGPTLYKRPAKMEFQTFINLNFHMTSGKRYPSPRNLEWEGVVSGYIAQNGGILPTSFAFLILKVNAPDEGFSSRYYPTIKQFHNPLYYLNSIGFEDTHLILQDPYNDSW